MSITDDFSSLESLLNSSRAYAGIGARSTPPPILFLMAKIASMFADYGLVLRSGASREQTRLSNRDAIGAMAKKRFSSHGKVSANTIPLTLRRPS